MTSPLILDASLFASSQKTLYSNSPEIILDGFSCIGSKARDFHSLR